MLDIRDHGGSFGGELSKGMSLKVGDLTPTSLPVRRGNVYTYTYSSTGLATRYDPISETVLHTHYVTGDRISVKLLNKDTAQFIRQFEPYLGFGTLFAHRPSAGRVYGNNSVSINSIVAVSDQNGASKLAEIPNKYVQSIIKYEGDEMWFFTNAELQKVNLATMTVTSIATGFGSNAVAKKIENYDKFIVINSTVSPQTKLVDINGNVVASTSNLPSHLSGGWFYHAPTNTFKTIGYKYGSSSTGGHYFVTINPSTLSIISEVRLSRYESVSVSSFDSVSYESNDKQFTMLIGEANGQSHVVLFSIKDDGSLKLPNDLITSTWFPFTSFPNFKSRGQFVAVPGGSFALDFYTDNNYYYYMHRIYTTYKWEG